MKDDTFFNSVIWYYIKYLGLPFTLSFVLYKIIVRLHRRKQWAQIKGKVVVITGASSGIGEALAHTFYNNGCKVVLAARREDELNRVKKDLMSRKLSVQPQEPFVLKLDLNDLDSFEAFAERVYQEYDDIDILINNGGISLRSSILETKPEVDMKIMNVNYFGSVFLTKAVLPKMVKRRSGHIVFVSSVQGRIGIPGRSAYAASKHAMQAFTDSLRAEMHQFNVNVSIVSPGYVKTAVSMNALTGSGEKHGVMDKETAAGLSPERVAQETLEMIVNNKPEIIPSQFLPKAAIFLRYFSPSLYFWVMAKRARRTHCS